jgi:hypothetical protein
VDDEDFALVSAYHWMVNRGGYAVRRVGNKTQWMHRVILGEPPRLGVVVDHINHDTLDNRRANLRWTTRSQNMQNRLASPQNSKLGVLGVSWKPDRQRFRARLTVQRIEVHVGYYRTLVEAEDAIRVARERFMGHSAERSSGPEPIERTGNTDTPTERRGHNM